MDVGRGKLGAQEQLSGYQIVSSTGVADFSGTFANGANTWAAAVVTLLPNIVNITTSGSVALRKPAMSSTGAGGNTSSTGSLALRKAALAATDIETFAASGSLALRKPALAATVAQGFPFPQAVLTVKAELLLNGTWTDISSYVYQRDAMVIDRGRPNEASTVNPSSLTLTLDNRDGRFSQRNSAGAYYPWLMRNVQIRVSAQDTAIAPAGSMSYRFWGEVTSWPQRSDPTNTDVYVTITASGILRRLSQGSTLGSALYRYYTRLSGNTEPIAYWPCEDGTSATALAQAITGVPATAGTFTGSPNLASDTSFGGSDAIPELNGSVWTLSTGVTGNPASTGSMTQTTPGTYTWTAPPGVTSINCQCWGAGGGGGAGGAYDVGSNVWAAGGTAGGGGEYAAESTLAVTPGTSYTYVVGIGGAGAAPNGTAGTLGGVSTFSGDTVTVTANGGSGGGGGYYDADSGGQGGTGSTNTVHYDGGAGGYGGSGSVFGPNFGGGGGGGSAGTASAGNAGGAGADGAGGAAATAVTGGGPGGYGGRTASGTQHDGFAPISGPGGGGGGGALEDATQYGGGNGYAGQVSFSWNSGTTSAVPANILRFALHVPSTGTADGGILARMFTLGTVYRVDVVYHTGGNLEMLGYDSSANLLFDSASQAFTADGTPMLVSAELAYSSGSVAWTLTAIKPGATSAIATYTGTVSGSVGDVTAVDVNAGATITDATAAGHYTVQHYADPLATVADALAGHDGELAGDRFTRLCAEENVGYTLTGNASDTPAMGPQADDTLVNLLQTIEDLDCGLLYEPRDSFGVGYRTRVSMQNQTAGLVIDYTAGELAGTLQPIFDDQLTRNDVTVSRVNGSSARDQDTSGAMSVHLPPNGVGRYTYTRSVSAHADSQLANEAAWILAVGTVDEERYPDVTVDLTRQPSRTIFTDVVSLDIGGYFQIANPPSWLAPATIKQLAYGFTETLNAKQWTVDVNAVPESPYEGANLPTW